MIIIITILAYFCVLLLFSHITERRTSSNETFYRANRRSPWYMVAFGMVGASISGITFVSVPGMVMNSAPAGNIYVNPKHSPQHGEYGLYKSANIKGKSGQVISGEVYQVWKREVLIVDDENNELMLPKTEIATA